MAGSGAGTATGGEPARAGEGAAAAPKGDGTTSTAKTAGAELVAGAGRGPSLVPRARAPQQQAPQVEVLVRHFIDGTEAVVRVPEEATFWDVKEAIAKAVGSAEALTNGHLMRKEDGVLSAYRDCDPVGDVRSVLLLRASLAVASSSSTQSAAAPASPSTGGAVDAERPPERKQPSMVVSRPSLSLEQILRLQEELHAAFADEDFQRKLVELERRRGKAFDKHTREHTALFSTVQNEILPKYGFSEGQRGVLQMLQEGARFNSNAEYDRNRLRLNQLLGLAPPQEEEEDMEELLSGAASPRACLVLGGEDGAATHDDCELLEVGAGEFVQGPRLGEQRSNCAVAPIRHQRLLVVGGSVGSKCLGTTEVLDLSTRHCAPGPPLATPRATCSAVRIDAQRVLVLGGRDRSNRLASTEVLDTRGMVVLPGPSMSTKRNMCGAVMLDAQRMLVLGGHDGSASLSSTEILDVGSMAFEPGPRLLGPRFSCALVRLDSRRILVAGGVGKGSTNSVLPRLDSTEVLDLSTMTFSSGPRMFSKRSSCSAVRLDPQHVMVVGGFDGSSRLKSTEVLDLETMRFSKGPSLSFARGGCTAVAVTL